MHYQRLRGIAAKNFAGVLCSVYRVACRDDGFIEIKFTAVAFLPKSAMIKKKVKIPERLICLMRFISYETGDGLGLTDTIFFTLCFIGIKFIFLSFSVLSRERTRPPLLKDGRCTSS